MTKDHRHPKPKQNGGEDKSNKRHVYLESGVQIDLVEGLKRSYEADRNERAAHDKKQLLWTGIGSFLVFVAAGCTFWQAWLVRESNSINHEALVSVQRAFVSFDALHLTPVARGADDPTPTWIIGIDAQNSGATPAIHVVRYFGTGVFTFEPDGEGFTGKVGNIRPDTIEIGAKSTQIINGPDSPNSFLFGKDGQHLQGDLPFLWGWVAYRDVFPNTEPHITEFCRVVVKAGYVPATADKPQRPNFDFRTCFKHNCTDKECEDYDKVVALAYP